MLPADVRSLLSGRNFCVLSTTGRDGQPRGFVMWVDSDDRYVYLNTERHRAQYRNLVAEPRASIIVWDAADPYRYVELRVRLADAQAGEAGRAHIDALSQKYRGCDYPQSSITSERVKLTFLVDDLRQFQR